MKQSTFALILFSFLICPKTWSATAEFDFSARDALPQTTIPQKNWKTCCGSWGPKAAAYPKIFFAGDEDTPEWKRARVIAVAKHYQGLPYAHKHIPAMGGLDCSNFTAWVYNYGFGIILNSNVKEQAETAGNKVGKTQELKPGDLLYIWNPAKTEIAHVVIFISPDEIIDDTKGKVAVRPFKGWYKTRFAWARRIFE